MISQFIDREEEIRILQEEYSHLPCFVILYGRRRVGKSRLIEEFSSGKKVFAYVFPDAVKKVQMQEFKERAASYFKDKYIKMLETESWFDIFSYISNLIHEEIVIVFDEFSYAIKSDQRITSDLQRVWDQSLSRKKVMLIVSGSMLSLMSEQVLSSASPLYGRRSRDILLQPLKPWDSLSFFSRKEYGFDAYMLVGGIPPYLTIASRYSNIERFVQAEFLDQNGYFYREPYFLLSQELRETKTYFSILSAIAEGNSTANTIANYVGMETRKIFPYLQQMLTLHIIRRKVPLMGPDRAGRYFIADNMVNSWFNLTFKIMSDMIPRTSVDKPELQSILGKPFEEVVSQYLYNFRFLPFEVDRIGPWWRKDNEIDLIAMNTKSRSSCFIEVKWRELGYKEAIKILDGLKKKSKEFDWLIANRSEYFGIIAKRIIKEDKERLRSNGYIAIDVDDMTRKAESLNA